jgi:hypothetical protein
LCGDGCDQHCVASQPVRRSENRSPILAERPVNGRLPSMRHQSPGSSFRDFRSPIADSLRRIFEKLPLFGDGGGDRVRSALCGGRIDWIRGSIPIARPACSRSRLLQAISLTIEPSNLAILSNPSKHRRSSVSQIDQTGKYYFSLLSCFFSNPRSI